VAINEMVREIASQLWRKSRMHGSVAFRTEADEIFFRIFALVAPTLNVMDLEPTQGAASLATPAISLEDFLM